MRWVGVPIDMPARGRHVGAVLGRWSGAPHGAPPTGPAGAAPGRHLTLASRHMTEALSSSGGSVMPLVMSSRPSRAARGRSSGPRPRGGRSCYGRSPKVAINERPKWDFHVLRALTRDSHLFYSLSGHPLRMSYLGRHNASKAQPPGTCACAQIRPKSQLQFAYDQHAHRIRRRQISLGHVRVACKGHDFDFRPAGGRSCCRRSPLQ